MMGDRDYRSLVQNAINSIGRELKIEIDADDTNTIHLQEVVRCMRRSYYDRTDPSEPEARGFNDLLSGLLRRFKEGVSPRHFEIDDLRLEGRIDMVADDVAILFRPMPAGGVRETDDNMESPHAADLLYLNACMWIYEKESGIIVYIAGDRSETMFSVARNKRMFEETIRRTRVFGRLLKEKKEPILEPSIECHGCQYYERCYTKRRNTKQISLHEMLGLGSSSKNQ